MAIEESEMALHRALVLQWIEAFNEHNVSALVALYTNDAELFDPSMKRPRRGRKEIERWFANRFQSMPSIAYIPASHLFPLYHLYEEAHAVVTWTACGKSPRLLGLAWFSRPFKVEGVSIFTFHEGLIQRQRGYYDHLSLVEQILPALKILPARL
jgi:steroid delta-isomerase-like uncharacterized protein